MTTDYDIGFGLYHKPGEMRNRRVHAGDMAVVVSSRHTERRFYWMLYIIVLVNHAIMNIA